MQIQKNYQNYIKNYFPRGKIFLSANHTSPPPNFLKTLARLIGIFLNIIFIIHNVNLIERTQWWCTWKFNQATYSTKIIYYIQVLLASAGTFSSGYDSNSHSWLRLFSSHFRTRIWSPRPSKHLSWLGERNNPPSPT